MCFLLCIYNFVKHRQRNEKIFMAPLPVSPVFMHVVGLFPSIFTFLVFCSLFVVFKKNVDTTFSLVRRLYMQSVCGLGSLIPHSIIAGCRVHLVTQLKMLNATVLLCRLIFSSNYMRLFRMSTYLSKSMKCMTIQFSFILCTLDKCTETLHRSLRESAIQTFFLLESI